MLPLSETEEVTETMSDFFNLVGLYQDPVIDIWNHPWLVLIEK